MKSLLLMARLGAPLRRLGTRGLGLFALLLPSLALAGEGDNVVLQFDGTGKAVLIAALVFGIAALIYAKVIADGVTRLSPGNEAMQEVGKAIHEGALAYLRQQIKAMRIFIVVIALGLAALYWKAGVVVGFGIAVCFVLGVLASYTAGYFGMLMAVRGNMRTANSAFAGPKPALETAFKSGSVAGLATVGVGIVGAAAILLVYPAKATTLLVGFGFGGSLAALFMRVGGGIYTKAADVGADLVGKVEAGIPEDDPRNPAVIADNVGDNVGDCAGMAADVFESYEVTLVASIVLGAATASLFDGTTWPRLVIFALATAGVGIVASMVGISSVRGSTDIDSDPLVPILKGFRRSAIVAVGLTFLVAFFLMGGIGPKIEAGSLVSIDQFRYDEVRTIQKVQKELASKRGVEPYAITAKDLLDSAELKALGFKPEQESTVMSAMNAPSTDVNIPSMAGYVRVSKEELSKESFPALKYALSADFNSGTEKYRTIASKFANNDPKEQLIAAKIKVVAKIPARKGENGQPDTPASNINNEGWIGPIRAGQLDDLIQQQLKQAKATGTDLKVDILDRKDVHLYYSAKADKFALGVAPGVDRPQTLNVAENLSYYKATVAQMKKVDEDRQKNPSMTGGPSMESIGLGVAKGGPVAWYLFALAVAAGVLLAVAIEKLTDYYVSASKRPTRDVAGVATAGPAPMIIQGFAYACESSVFMVLAIVGGLLIPLFLFPVAAYGTAILAFYGVALVGLGLLGTTGYILAMDTFGPISDNAQGVFEMSKGAEEENGQQAGLALQRLDAAGNTTKALTKGFAIATAVVAAVALFHSFVESAHLESIGLRLDIPEIFLGLLIGGAAPFLFSAFAINAVGRSSFDLIKEVRRQFKEDPGILLGLSKPDYARCVAIVTAAAQKELLGPGILALALPIAVGFGFSIGREPVTIGGTAYNLVGAQALGGFLAGAIVSGQLMAVLLANSGGMWDNAKKIIEDGMHGGKGTDAHKASVVCDTVGDPFKDTAGPALNPLIKVMNLVALLLVGIIVQPMGVAVPVIVTAIAVAALVFAVVRSKKDSMSDKFDSELKA